MSSTDRRARQKAEVQQKILDAARLQFAARGYEAVTMRSIAEAIEYTPAALYVHFPDKEALLWKLCEQDFAALGVTFGKTASIADPVERIRAIGKEYARFGIKHPNHYRLMFLTDRPCVVPEQIVVRHNDPSTDGYAFLRLAVTEAIDAKRFGVADVELVTQTLWAGVHGVVALELQHNKGNTLVDWRSFERRLDTMVDAVLAGLMVGAKPGKRSSRR